MSSLARLGPSPEHAVYKPLMPAYLDKVTQQEKNLVAAGWPAEGMSDFVRTWFHGWATQDTSVLRSCLTDTCDFIDSTTFGQIRQGVDVTMANIDAAFVAFPDMSFYLQDNTVRSLPYHDYFEGQWRMTIPWRGICRWSGEGTIPDTDIRLVPSGQCLNFIGIDRYMLTSDFKIDHIDTDWDMFNSFLQLAPFKLPTSLPYSVLRPAMAVQRAITPALRRFRLSSSEDRPGTDAQQALTLDSAHNTHHVASR